MGKYSLEELTATDEISEVRKWRKTGARNRYCRLMCISNIVSKEPFVITLNVL